MGKVILGMTMSLDGYICDTEGSIEALFADAQELANSRVLSDSLRYTGAVVMGKNTFEMMNVAQYAQNFDSPISVFVLTHEAPTTLPEATDKLKFAFVTDGITNAIAQAKAAAGERDVQVIGGANTFAQCLGERLCDEVQLDVVSLLLGSGIRLFESIDTLDLVLERTGVEIPTPFRTTITMRLG